MPKLSKEQFNKAKSFIMEKAKKFEQAMFENGTKENLLAELKAYQNSDAGFGNAIEPHCNETSA